MIEFAMIVLIGLIGGVAVGLQSPIAGVLGQRLGGTASSFVVHLSGVIFSGVWLIVRGGENIRDWRAVPWYMFGAGIFGLILYQTISVTLPRLGSTMTITLIIIGQLLIGVVVDHFGWLGVAARPVDAARIVGVIALLFGGYLITK